MNVFAWVLLAALAVAAGASWVALARGLPQMRSLSRPVMRILLLALAWLLRADTVDYGRWLLLALVLGLIADWLRAARVPGPPEGPAPVGQVPDGQAPDGQAPDGRRAVGERVARAAVLLSRMAYLVALVLLPAGGGLAWPLGAAALVVAAWAVRLAARPVARDEWRHGIPLLGYAVLGAALLAAGWSSGSVAVGVGATLLCAAAAVAGRHRPAARRQAAERPSGRPAATGPAAAPARAALGAEVLGDIAEVLIVLGLLRG